MYSEIISVWSKDIYYKLYLPIFYRLLNILGLPQFTSWKITLKFIYKKVTFKFLAYEFRLDDSMVEVRNTEELKQSQEKTGQNEDGVISLNAMKNVIKQWASMHF